MRQDLPTAAKAKGQQTRETLVWEVVDQKLAFERHPHCFDVTPKASVIKACIVPAPSKNEADPETDLYPGFKCWWRKEVIFSSR